MSGHGAYTMFPKSYHQLLWWSTIGYERSPILDDVANRTFTLSTASAGVEGSFEVLSRAHRKHRVQLADVKADKQCSIIYNSTQLKRIDDGVLATRRDGNIETLLFMGYNKYLRKNGSNIANMLTDSSPEIENDDRSSELAVPDFDDEELFGRIEYFEGNLNDFIKPTELSEQRGCGKDGMVGSGTTT